MYLKVQRQVIEHHINPVVLTHDFRSSVGSTLRLKQERSARLISSASFFMADGNNNHDPGAFFRQITLHATIGA